MRLCRLSGLTRSSTIVITSYPGDLILCYDNYMQLLTTMRSPTHESALTTYQGRLVMVGGREVATGDTNKLWSLQDDGTWAEDLPPMPTRRRSASAVSSGHHLLVAGGMGEDRRETAVEVFDGKRWSTTEPLPKPGFFDMKSALLNGEWYLMGGWRQGRSVFSASVAALLASARKVEGTHSVWRILPVAPLEKSSPAAFGSLLLAIGGLGEYNFLCHCTQQALNSAPDCGVQWLRSGLRMFHHITGGSPSDAIHAFIPDTLSWLHVADLPEPMLSASSLVLPSGDLVVVKNEVSKSSISVLRASLKGKCHTLSVIYIW